MRTPSSSEEAGDLAKVTRQVNSRVTARTQSCKACLCWAPVPTKGRGETRESSQGSDCHSPVQMAWQSQGRAFLSAATMMPPHPPSSAPDSCLHWLWPSGDAKARGSVPVGAPWDLALPTSSHPLPPPPQPRALHHLLVS